MNNTETPTTTVNYTELADRFAELLRRRALEGADIKELRRIAASLTSAQKMEAQQERRNTLPSFGQQEVRKG